MGKRLGRYVFGPFVVFFVAFFATLTWVSIDSTPSANVSYADNTAVGAKIEPALVFYAGTDGDLGTANVATAALKTKDLSMTVSTNNPTGYSLSINMKTVEPCLRQSADVGNSCAGIDADKKIIPLAGTNVATGSFPANQWGISINSPSFTTWNSVPISSAAAYVVRNQSTNIVNQSTTMRFGAKVNIGIKPATYDNVVVVSAVANPRFIPQLSGTTSPDRGTVGTVISFSIPGTGAFNSQPSQYVWRYYVGGRQCENVNVSIGAYSDTIQCTVPDFGDGYNNTLAVTCTTIHGDNCVSTLTFIYQSPQMFAFTIDTRMTDTLDTDPTHYDGTSTVFAIPKSNSMSSCSVFDGYGTGCATSIGNWVIDWGDGTPRERASAARTGDAAGIIHDYVATGPGEYQIKIFSDGVMNSYYGWMNTFGFNSTTTGANTQANKNMLKSIDTPFPARAFAIDPVNRFAYMFYGCRNAIGIPSNLFSLMGTYGSNNNNWSGLLRGTFSYFAYNSTTATIPAGLLGSIFNVGVARTSYTNISYAFDSTFAYAMYNSQRATIPNNFLSFLNFTNFGTTQINSGYSLFNSTFQYYGYASDLTTDINTVWGAVNFAGRFPAAVNLSGNFNNTFQGMRSLTGTAQTFIDNRLGGLAPSSRSYTFDGTSVSDLAGLNANWK